MAGIVDKFKRMWDAPDDEYEYDEYGYAEDEQDSYDEDERDSDRGSSRSGGRNKVVSINATAKLKVAYFKPERFGEEIRGIAQELLKNHTVVLNLEDTNKDMARRTLDFLSGVAFANNGKIRRVAVNTYIMIPSNVDLTGDELFDELENNGVYF